ncbi:MAG: helix-turn-helix domain-containing protein [Sulfuricurvum sp.]|nr:helix-turn-helix domain-containing protein [Sulfuricurvum sp.]
MNVMNEIVERIKDVISNDHPGKNIKDKHVAHALDMKPNCLYLKKSRGLLPYETVVLFCIRRNVSLNWMLFGVGSMRLDDAVKSL